MRKHHFFLNFKFAVRKRSNSYLLCFYVKFGFDVLGILGSAQQQFLSISPSSHRCLLLQVGVALLVLLFPSPCASRFPSRPRVLTLYHILTSECFSPLSESISKIRLLTLSYLFIFFKTTSYPLDRAWKVCERF